MRTGVLYVAIGEQSYNEAVVSASSVKDKMDIEIAVVTNMVGVGHPFDLIIPIELDVYMPKIKIDAIAHSQFDRTLWLDTDTYMLHPVDDVLTDILDRFDIAGVHQPNRYNWPTFRPMPMGFPEINGGFVAVKRGKATELLMLMWANCYLGVGSPRGDQGALREAIYYSGARVCILPPEYNMRLGRDTVVSSGVRILHGHKSKEAFERIAPIVNATSAQRVIRAVDMNQWR